MRASWRSILVLLAAAPCVPRPAGAQAGYEIEVYASVVVPVRTLLLELHNNYIFTGQQLSTGAGRGPVVDDEWRGSSALAMLADSTCTTTRPAFRIVSNGSVARSAAGRASAAAATCTTTVGSNTAQETLEAATGVSSWAEVAAYIFAAKDGSAAPQWAGESFRARVHVPEAWHWGFGAGLSTEVEHEYVPNASDTWTLEFRPIFDKTLGRWYVSINPTLEHTLSSSGASGVQFSPSSRLNYDFTRGLTGGIEYYGAFGSIGSFPAPNDRLQQFFATVSIHTSLSWEVEAGAGLGTTTATNRLTAKLIFEHSISWGGTASP